MTRVLLAAIVILTIYGCANQPLPTANNRFGAVPCSPRFGCPDTPIGNYNEWKKPGTAPLPSGTTFGCKQGDTELIVRGAANPQACKPVERI